MRREPSENAPLKLLRVGADCAAVIGGRNFPELGTGSAGLNAAGVPDRNVTVELAVNEENRNCRGGDRIFGRNLLHVEVIFKAGAKKCDFHQRTEKRSPDPGAEVKGLSHAIVSDLTKRRERRLGDNGTEMRMGIKRLEELRCAHRFGESEDAP